VLTSFKVTTWFVGASDVYVLSSAVFAITLSTGSAPSVTSPSNTLTGVISSLVESGYSISSL